MNSLVEHVKTVQKDGMERRAALCAVVVALLVNVYKVAVHVLGAVCLERLDQHVMKVHVHINIRYYSVSITLLKHSHTITLYYSVRMTLVKHSQTIIMVLCSILQA